MLIQKRILRIYGLGLVDSAEYPELTNYRDLKIENIIKIESALKGYKRELFILVVIILNHEVKGEQNSKLERKLKVLNLS